MLVRYPVAATLILATGLLAGCADSSSLFGGSTSNLTTQSTAAPVVVAVPKYDPACPSLASQIEGLRKEGVADKIEKAALKKYKMTSADLAKADQLNKSNADFQGKCSTYKTTVAQAAPVATVTPVAKPAAQ